MWNLWVWILNIKHCISTFYLSVSAAQTIRVLTASPSTCWTACSSSPHRRTPRRRRGRSWRSGEKLCFILCLHRLLLRRVIKEMCSHVSSQVWRRGRGAERGGSHRPDPHRHGDVTALRHPADQHRRTGVSQTQSKLSVRRVWKRIKQW